MRLLFHIGMAKTGSSALQHALYASTKYLASKGILYPINPARGSARNHRIYATQMAPLANLPRHMAFLHEEAQAQESFAKFHASVKAQVMEQRPQLVLMSAETLFRNIAHGYEGRLQRSLSEIDANPRFVAYLRRPADRYVSGLQQKLKGSSHVMQPRGANTRRNILSYEKVFGTNCLDLHVFHRSILKDGDIIADFCARHLADYEVNVSELTPVGEINVSISAESMVVMQWYRKTFYPGEDDRLTKDSDALRATLRELDETVGAGRPSLRPNIAEIVDYSSSDPLWLRDTRGIIFPDFDYRPLELGKLKKRSTSQDLTLRDIIFIDDSKLRAIIETLADTEWATKIPRRQRWVHEIATSAFNHEPASQD